MGARLYNSVTGLFTIRDPVEGENSTSYAYPLNPVGAPVGASDISGEWSWRDTADVALTAASFIPGVNTVAIPLRIASIGVRSYQVARDAYHATKILRRTKRFMRSTRRGYYVTRHRSYSPRASNWAGRMYVGRGYKTTRGGRTWTSRNGLHEYRKPSVKYNKKIKRGHAYQSNFSSKSKGSSRRSGWQKNYHVSISPKHRRMY